jgi:hypothetical protein
MLDRDIPAKTKTGFQEIRIREHKLTPRARSVLISINGHQSVSELRKQFKVLGDVLPILDQLEKLGLINGLVNVSQAANEPNMQATAQAKAQAAAIERHADLTPAFMAKQLINETAVDALGLFAFTFTLKLEHCYTVDELRGILPEFSRVLTKKKGPEFAKFMTERVEHLLYGA